MKPQATMLVKASLRNLITRVLTTGNYWCSVTRGKGARLEDTQRGIGVFSNEGPTGKYCKGAKEEKIDMSCMS